MDEQPNQPEPEHAYTEEELLEMSQRTGWPVTLDDCKLLNSLKSSVKKMFQQPTDQKKE